MLSINKLLNEYDGVEDENGATQKGILDESHPDFKQTIVLFASWANRTGGLNGTINRLNKDDILLGTGLIN